jgi:hypothetical protein
MGRPRAPPPFPPPPKLPPPSYPPNDNVCLETTCGFNSKCSQVIGTFSCDQLELVGCNCWGCCTVGPSPPSSPLAPPELEGCGDSCHFAADGYCDDGGQGAQYTDCGLGTDCMDCGQRSMDAPQPPASPPSTPPFSYDELKPYETMIYLCVGSVALFFLGAVFSIQVEGRMGIELLRFWAFLMWGVPITGQKGYIMMLNPRLRCAIVVWSITWIVCAVIAMYLLIQITNGTRGRTELDTAFAFGCIGSYPFFMVVASMLFANLFRECLLQASRFRKSFRQEMELVRHGEPALEEKQKQIDVAEREGRCKFHFLRADYIRGLQCDARGNVMCPYGRTSLPRFQELREEQPDQLREVDMSRAESYRGSFRHKYVVVSHAWDEPGVPDSVGAKIRQIKSFLEEYPQIEWVWFDFWCLPQVETEKRFTIRLRAADSWVGIGSLAEISEELDNGKPTAKITYIHKGSPMALDGQARVGDEIISIDGKSPDHPLPRALGGREYSIKLLRRSSHRQRTAIDNMLFKWQLANCNWLYLGCSVLALVDLSYQSRFWTQFELWLSLQTTTPDGLVPAALRNTQGLGTREHMWPVHSATPDLAEKLQQMWHKLTPAEAHKVLNAPDVHVTNQSDKEGQLARILKLDEDVRAALGDASAASSSATPVLGAEPQPPCVHDDGVFENPFEV